MTRDRAHHNLLDRPRDRPVRTAIGATALTFYGLLLLAGSNDVMARILHVPVNAITSTFQIMVLVLPILVGLLVNRLMQGYARSRAGRFMEVPFGAFLGRPVDEHGGVAMTGGPSAAAVTGPPVPADRED